MGNIYRKILIIIAILTFSKGLWASLPGEPLAFSETHQGVFHKCDLSRLSQLLDAIDNNDIAFVKDMLDQPETMALLKAYVPIQTRRYPIDIVRRRICLVAYEFMRLCYEYPQEKSCPNPDENNVPRSLSVNALQMHSQQIHRSSSLRHITRERERKFQMHRSRSFAAVPEDVKEVAREYAVNSLHQAMLSTVLIYAIVKQKKEIAFLIIESIENDIKMLRDENPGDFVYCPTFDLVDYFEHSALYYASTLPDMQEVAEKLSNLGAFQI